MSGENYINHVALVLDASSSMSGNRNTLIKVADEQIRYLAERSKELDQETRVTVYTFDSTVRCLIYDKDVLRLPSIATLYTVGGMTALVDAAILSLDDLALQPEKYGDHAFLVYVLTDGQENASRNLRSALTDRLRRVKDNWTIAALVPDRTGERYAHDLGFPAGNIAIWDATSSRGVEQSFASIRTATDNFMTMRSQGVRSTRSIFSTGADAVNSQTVKSVLKPLPSSNYAILNVPSVQEIRPFVQANGYFYKTGNAYYQLSKTEHIQPQKKLAVFEKKTGKVYVGDQARDLVGLTSTLTKVKPEYNADYDVFVQSTSVNRKLMPNTKLLLLV